MSDQVKVNEDIASAKGRESSEAHPLTIYLIEGDLVISGDGIELFRTNSAKKAGRFLNGWMEGQIDE